MKPEAATLALHYWQMGSHSPMYSGVPGVAPAARHVVVTHSMWWNHHRDQTVLNCCRCLLKQPLDAAASRATEERSVKQALPTLDGVLYTLHACAAAGYD